MPEGVEVRVITEQLAKRCNNRTLQQLEIIGGRFTRLPPDNLVVFKQNIPVQIMQVGCKGKFIWFAFKNDWYLFNTLGMTGSWGDSQEKHSAISLHLEDGIIYFTDPRRFGTLRFFYGKEELTKKLNSLGPNLLEEALGTGINKYRFRNRLKNRPEGETLAESLMNQKVFSGIGNYLKAESLYAARLSPWRHSDSLSNEEYFRLAECLCSILTQSYRDGGTTIATYKNFQGEIGKFSSKLKIYGKILDPLGNPIKTETTLDKRTTWWVPFLQH